ncbi:MAG TPA: hypothetical protein PK191_04495 [Niabella sp.]|nr:hypothetical protein [Niabella sp.]HOZ97805.1 hypothetical protein [Niabella sp.]HQW15644.1 hypothetical protein [Niabella sp.]HQX20839.1 hypothetical protein [Niabella sp.]HRB07773.1 hypothetical protein [Niabella sp.]
MLSSFYDLWSLISLKEGVADALANHFNKDIFMLPEFPNPSKDWRYPYFHRLYNGKFKQPDFQFDSISWEMESHEKKFQISKINKMLENGLEQSKNIILKVNSKIDIDRVLKKSKAEKSSICVKGFC